MNGKSSAIPRSGRFVIHGPPLPNEALRGYMLRLVEANCLAGPNVFQFKGDFLVPRCLASLRAVAEGGGVELDALRSLYGSGGSSWRAQMAESGAVVPLRFLHARRTKVCPRCIEECRFIPAVWELGLVAACPIHRCEMLWECPGCGEPIDWRRRSVAFCCEGAPFESASPAAADPKVVDLTRAIARLVDPRSPAPSAAVRGGVQSLKLEELLTLVIHVGSVGTDLLRARASSWGKSAVEPILVRAASVLLHWPSGMPAFARSVIGTAEYVSAVSTRKALGVWAADRLWMQLGGEQYAFFREEFWRQVGVLAQGVAAARCKSNAAAGLVSTREAGKLFSVTHSWLKAWGATGRLPSTAYSAGTGVRRMYGSSHIVSLIREIASMPTKNHEGEPSDGRPFPTAVFNREGCVSVDYAAALLGIPAAAVTVLARRGLLASHEIGG
jgi:hypothetical protein